MTWPQLARLALPFLLGLIAMMFFADVMKALGVLLQ